MFFEFLSGLVQRRVRKERDMAATFEADVMALNDELQLLSATL